MLHSWFEYSLVAASLVITVGIGIYAGRGQKTLQDYMLGDKKLTILPISLSVAATQISGSAIVSLAEEVYLYGLPVALNASIQLIYGVIFAYVFLPVSYSVKSVSTFEFFDRRFNNHVRKYASVLFALEIILHTGVSQYVPAVTLSQATGFPVFPIACVLSLLCWVYTATGGFRAVTYADSFQALLFMGVIMSLFGLGIFNTGGFLNIWNKGTEGYRTQLLDWSLSYDSRYTVLLTMTCGFMYITRNFFSPSFHQRVVAMPTYEEAKRVTLWSSFITSICLVFCASMGLMVYVYYAGCDPILEGKDIKNYGRILPYFVEEISQNVPGLTGLFLSGVIAAGLSTTTSCWNTVTCTLYEDIAKPLLPRSASKRVQFRVLNLILLSVALVSTFTVQIIQNIPSLLEATLSLKSFTACGSFSLHIVGMLLPWINTKGALAGSFVSSVMTTYIAVGAQHARSNKLVYYIPKILTNAECIVNGTTMALLNQTMTIGEASFGTTSQSDPTVPWYFKISFYIYYVPGFVMGLMTSYLVSRMTGHEDLNKLDREMIVPLMRWALPRPQSTDALEIEVPLRINDDLPSSS